MVLYLCFQDEGNLLGSGNVGRIAARTGSERKPSGMDDCRSALLLGRNKRAAGSIPTTMTRQTFESEINIGIGIGIAKSSGIPVGKPDAECGLYKEN